MKNYRWSKPTRGFSFPIDALYKLVFALLKLPVAQNNKQLYILWLWVAQTKQDQTPTTTKWTVQINEQNIRQCNLFPPQNGVIHL